MHYRKKSALSLLLLMLCINADMNAANDSWANTNDSWANTISGFAQQAWNALPSRQQITNTLNHTNLTSEQQRSLLIGAAALGVLGVGLYIYNQGKPEIIDEDLLVQQFSALTQDYEGKNQDEQTDLIKKIWNIRNEIYAALLQPANFDNKRINNLTSLALNINKFLLKKISALDITTNPNHTHDVLISLPSITINSSKNERLLKQNKIINDRLTSKKSAITYFQTLSWYWSNKIADPNISQKDLQSFTKLGERIKEIDIKTDRNILLQQYNALTGSIPNQAATPIALSDQPSSQFIPENSILNLEIEFREKIENATSAEDANRLANEFNERIQQLDNPNPSQKNFIGIAQQKIEIERERKEFNLTQPSSKLWKGHQNPIGMSILGLPEPLPKKEPSIKFLTKDIVNQLLLQINNATSFNDLERINEDADTYQINNREELRRFEDASNRKYTELVDQEFSKETQPGLTSKMGALATVAQAHKEQPTTPTHATQTSQSPTAPSLTPTTPETPSPISAPQAPVLLTPPTKSTEPTLAKAPTPAATEPVASLQTKSTSVEPTPTLSSKQDTTTKEDAPTEKATTSITELLNKLEKIDISDQDSWDDMENLEQLYLNILRPLTDADRDNIQKTINRFEKELEGKKTAHFQSLKITPQQQGQESEKPDIMSQFIKEKISQKIYDTPVFIKNDTNTPITLHGTWVNSSGTESTINKNLSKGEQLELPSAQKLNIRYYNSESWFNHYITETLDNNEPRLITLQDSALLGYTYTITNALENAPHLLLQVDPIEASYEDITKTIADQKERGSQLVDDQLLHKATYYTIAGLGNIGKRIKDILATLRPMPIVTDNTGAITSIGNPAAIWSALKPILEELQKMLALDDTAAKKYMEKALIVYLYEIAHKQGHIFDEGTFILHDKLASIVFAFLANMPGVYKRNATHLTGLYRDNPEKYSQLAMIGKNYFGSPVDLTKESKIWGDEGPKTTILFNRITYKKEKSDNETHYTPTSIMIKPERHGTDTWTDTALHGLDLVVTKWDKLMGGDSDDQHKYSKERVPVAALGEYAKLIDKTVQNITQENIDTLANKKPEDFTRQLQTWNQDLADTNQDVLDNLKQENALTKEQKEALALLKTKLYTTLSSPAIKNMLLRYNTRDGWGIQKMLQLTDTQNPPREIAENDHGPSVNQGDDLITLFTPQETLTTFREQLQRLLATRPGHNTHPTKRYGGEVIVTDHELLGNNRGSSSASIHQ